MAILLISIIVNYYSGLLIENNNKIKSKAILVLSISINLLMLGMFKYINFIAQNIDYLFGINFTFSQLYFPIGISFYTFKAISYLVDVYRGEAAAQKSFCKMALYISFFPQLIAGPIARYKEFGAEINNRSFSLSGFREGVNRFIVGLGKKVILANTAEEISVFFLGGNISDLPILGAWFGITLFALQIYFDFSGYTDMAIGLGKMFGFNCAENFNYPYISTSATEFWRRWHMTLGSFFRDYVYIPLGGNKKHFILNLFVVWSFNRAMAWRELELCDMGFIFWLFDYDRKNSIA